MKMNERKINPQELFDERKHRRLGIIKGLEEKQVIKKTLERKDEGYVSSTSSESEDNLITEAYPFK